MSKEMREHIDKFKDYLLNEDKKLDLYKKYTNVIFSEDFYKQDEGMIKYLEKTYLTKIDDFINFYKKYKPKGIRIIDGHDFYEESKSIFDKVVSGKVYIDKVFRNPDNPLRNIVMLLHIDEPTLKRKVGE